MSDELFNVVFRGDIVPGQSLPEVKQRFAHVFRLEPDKVDAYFSGKPVTLKKECDRATADKFKAVLQQAGALVDIKSASVPAVAPRPAPARPVAAMPPAVAAPVVAAPVVAAAATPTPVPVAPVQTVPVEPSPADWTLNRQGTELLRPEERVAPPPAQISIDHIQLKKRNPFALDDEEPLEEAKETPPPTLDLSAYKLAASGVPLADETPFVPLNIDLSALTLDRPGADVLREDEREVVVPVVVDVSAMSLAAPGGELGEIERPAPPPPPPTDHLSFDK